VKSAAYTSMVRPTMEYASSVWNPTNRKKIGNLEKVQKRAARFVFNNYTMVTPRYLLASTVSNIQASNRQIWYRHPNSEAGNDEIQNVQREISSIYIHGETNNGVCKLSMGPDKPEKDWQP
jgi:hypothetical protein